MIAWENFTLPNSTQLLEALNGTITYVIDGAVAAANTTNAEKRAFAKQLYRNASSMTKSLANQLRNTTEFYALELAFEVGINVTELEAKIASELVNRGLQDWLVNRDAPVCTHVLLWELCGSAPPDSTSFDQVWLQRASGGLGLQDWAVKQYLSASTSLSDSISRLRYMMNSAVLASAQWFLTSTN
jgi:hypothetical protein